MIAVFFWIVVLCALLLNSTSAFVETSLLRIHDGLLHTILTHCGLRYHRLQNNLGNGVHRRSAEDSRGKLQAHRTSRLFKQGVQGEQHHNGQQFSGCEILLFFSAAAAALHLTSLGRVRNAQYEYVLSSTGTAARGSQATFPGSNRVVTLDEKWAELV